MTNNSRTMIPSPQLQITNSSFIKSEIERFESVHPSIYSIYELIDELKDQGSIQSQIRDHVMVIEGTFEQREGEKDGRFVLQILL